MHVEVRHVKVKPELQKSFGRDRIDKAAIALPCFAGIVHTVKKKNCPCTVYVHCHVLGFAAIALLAGMVHTTPVQCTAVYTAMCWVLVQEKLKIASNTPLLRK